MSQRVSLYNEIHKALRRELMQLLMETARVDLEQRERITSLAARFEALAEMLREHAEHEDRHVEPLIRQHRPDLAAELGREHETLDAKLVAVRARVREWAQASEAELAECGYRAHAHLAAFVGAYLGHMSREEDEAMPVLQAVMTDEELLEVTQRLRSAIPPARMADYIEIMLPAMNVQERHAMFAGLKAAAPPPVLQGMCELAASVLSDGEWSQLRQRAQL